MCHKRTVISKKNFLDEVKDGLCFGSEATKIKQRAIQTTSDVQPTLQILHCMSHYACEEDVDEGGQNPSLFHSITDFKRLCCIFTGENLTSHTIIKIAEGYFQISVGIKFARGLSIEPSCWWRQMLSSSLWRQSRVACFVQFTFLVVVSWQKSSPLCFGLTWSHIVPLEDSVLLQRRVCSRWLEQKSCQQWRGVRLLCSFHTLFCFPCFWREKLSGHRGIHKASSPLSRCSAGHHGRPQGRWDLLLYTAQQG